MRHGHVTSIEIVCGASVKNSKGFALFEVMVATAILATAGLFLSRSLNAAFIAGRTAHDYYRASLMLENALWNLDRGSPVPSDSGDSLAAPDEPDALRNARWTLEESIPSSGNLKRRTVTLSWGRKDFLDLSSYAAE